MRDSIRLVIRDQAELASVWEKATSASPLALPPIDFEREMVILVGAGRMKPDDEIHVDSLYRRPELTPEGRRVETLTVVVRTVQGCGRLRLDAYPIEIVKVRKFDGPVSFEDRKVSQNCSDRDR